MKLIKILGFSAALLACTALSSAQAFEYQWPTNPVIGVVGASFADCSLPMNTPLMGVGFAGCSYEALEKKLTKHHELNKMGFSVQSAAQAGSRSHDVPGTGWLGYTSQVGQLNMTTFWFDGVQRLKYLVVSIPNDCLHSLPCTVMDMQDTIDRVKSATNMATGMGATVLINGYPEWADLDLHAASMVFGLTNLIDEADYLTFTKMHRDQLSVMPGVVYVDAWQDNFSTVDGLHPTVENQVEAADRIARIIKDLEKGKY